MTKMKTGMTDQEFQKWKTDWFRRIPKCKKFACVHELTSCAIRPLCGCGSIYPTYKNQKEPEECTTVSCPDCFNYRDCYKEKLNEQTK